MDDLQIRFGADATWSLPASDQIASFLEPNCSAVEDVARALDDAFQDPIDFPSLDQAFVSGDQVVLAVDPNLPDLATIVESSTDWFARAGVVPQNLRIVFADDVLPDAFRIVQQRVHQQLGEAVILEVHDPDDQNKIAYVAANEESDPIYMNRSIVDADVVIPITCARPPGMFDYLGAYSLFPLLSDRATRGRFYSLPKLDATEQHAKLRAWADQAAWWVGLLTAIQIIPAGNDRIAAVLAGQTEPLESASQDAMQRAWSTPAATSDLVIALVDGDLAQQTWLNVSRALYTASKCTSHGGTIVLCTQLREPIGEGLSRLRTTHESSEVTAKKLADDSYSDAIAASVILQATADHHVYLVSELRAPIVESLGMGVMNDAEQLDRLVKQHASCTILGSAQHRWLQPQ